MVLWSQQRSGGIDGRRAKLFSPVTSGKAAKFGEVGRRSQGNKGRRYAEFAVVWAYTVLVAYCDSKLI